ncbi:hypothetical protein DFH06DRAFT_1265823 [Mycena polygramma]|nr:hypothetical protein DFH06DRAFT_1265823 [Mycena polygramma]
MIKTVNSGERAPSTDKSEFDAVVAEQSLQLGDWLEEDDESGERFVPGTFVELRRNESATHGIVLGEEYKDSRMHVIVLVSTGEVWDPLREDVMFSVPNLAPPDLARRGSVLLIAVDEVQLNARVKLLQHIRQIERAVEGASADIIRSGIDVYSIVKSRDPEQWGTTTVAEVARLFEPKPKLITIFATHKYLMDRPEQFLANHGYILNQSFGVRPESHIATIKTVTEWVRMRNGPIQDFAKRVAPVIAANRQLQSETRTGVPSQRPAKHTWTPDDLHILAFLHRSLQPERSIQADPYAIGHNVIIRTLNPDQTVDDDLVHKALMDLGVYAPWQDVYSLRRAMNLDQEDPATSPKFKATEALVQRSLAAPARSGPLGPEDFYPTDPLDNLRHDFGDMPIYVVDDHGAQELDDGLSVEAIPGEPGSYWMHVHIADPASVIPPTHILAQRASKQSQTAYFLHRSWPLIPKSLMFSGRQGFSLAGNAENRVLTFSSKLNSAGELVDCVVRPGIARNFVILSYEEVDLALRGEVMPRIYPFSDARVPPAPPQLPDGQLNDLRTLEMLQKRLMKHRVTKGVFEPVTEAIHLTDFVAPENITSPTMQPSEFRGFPKYNYSISHQFDAVLSSRGMVAEAMKVACRTASRWCVERGVDVIRRTGSPFIAPPKAMEEMLAMRTEYGTVDIASIAALSAAMPVAGYSVDPAGHWSMAVSDGEGYARVTSPLRRYSDLVAHYQIHASLLGNKAPFSRAYLNDYLQWLKHDDQLKKRTETLHQRFWALYALRRWLEAPRTDIPDPLLNLEAVVMRPCRINALTNTVQSEVRIPVLGIAANMQDIPQKLATTWRIGSSIPVKIEAVKLGVRPRLVVSAVTK